MKDKDYMVFRFSQECDQVVRHLNPDGDGLMNCINDEPKTFQDGDEIFEVKYVGSLKVQEATIVLDK